MPNIVEIHANRDILFSSDRIKNPLSAQQFVELANLLLPATQFGSDKSPEWQRGHKSGILLAMTLLERSSELYR